MSFNTLTRRNDYLGDGSTLVFPFTFKIYDQSQLLIIKRTVLAAEVTLTLATDYTVQGVGLNTGGTVTLLIAPVVGETLTIFGAQPLSQTTSIRNQDAYYPGVIEDALDMARMIDQQQADQITRSLKVAATTRNFSATIQPIAVTDGNKVIRIKSDVSGFETVDPLSILTGAGAPTGKLKAPTDGTYGGTAGNPSKVAIGDLYEDAFDKVATLLGKMVPPAPLNLSALSLNLTFSYQALRAGTGTLDLVTDQTAPTVTPGLSAIYANAFGDSDAGTLSAIVDSAQTGQVILTPGDDSGLTNGQLTIISEFDPYAGQSGKAGLYKALTAKITPSLTTGQHTAQLAHSTTGSTPVFTFFVDDPGAPTVGSLQLQPSGTINYLSGVPSYAAGATIAVRFSASNVVNSHYSPTYIVAVTSTASNGTVTKQPSTPPTAYQAYADNAQLTVASGVYGESVTASVQAYNSKQVGMNAPATVSSAIRVDTIGTEQRVTSGTGQFPTSGTGGYGQTYDSTLSLASNKALQYLAGAYRYPPAVSYANAIPAGPDYSSLTPDTYNNMRWVTFAYSTVNAVTSVTFNLNNAQNFGASAIVSGFSLYVRVDGSTPTSGWVDANAAYAGTGSPTANGDAALDVSNSTATLKRVTFGTTVRTGTVYIRVGIPQGSSKFFGGVS